VTRRIPPSARTVLDEGVLCHLAVSTPNGLHCTPVAFVLDGGRLWITTSRSSVKALAWRRDPTVAGLVQAGELAVAFRGRIRTYDALDPLSWPAAAVAGPRLASAAARYTLKNARFFAGYAVDAGRVPLAWSPPGRVFGGVELSAGRVLAPDTGAVVDGWGEWPAGPVYEPIYAPLGRSPSLDRRVPASVRDAVGSSGRGALAFKSNGVLTVLPVAWRRRTAEGSYEAGLPEGFVRLACTERRTPAALTISRTASWRASEMAGMLLQGSAQLYVLGRLSRGTGRVRRRLDATWPGPVGGEAVLARLRPSRVVWWEGWTSGNARTSPRS
jgi:hypothetical protein